MQSWIGPIIGSWLNRIADGAGIWDSVSRTDRAEKAFEKGKRSPFPQRVSAGGGHSLYEQIEKPRVDFMGWLMGVMIMPLS